MSGPSPGAAPRGRLLRKYIVVFVGLVGGVLMASSLVELYFAYQETKGAIVREERATAVATAAKIEEFARDIERRVLETTRAASDDPAAAQLGLGKLAFRGGLGASLTEQRQLDFLRLLRDVPAIGELGHLDVSGKEQLRVSRLALDAVGSQEDFSQTPKFLETRSGKTYWSPVYFRSGVQPYVTFAVPVGQYAVEVTTAEISLKAVQQAITQTRVGRGGYAYVVDSRGRLFAHPDLGLVRQNRDLSALPQVRDARVGGPTAPGGPPGPTAPGVTGAKDAVTVAEGLRGGQILAAHAAIAPLGWLVVVERPLAEAYAPLRAPIIRSVVIFVLGLALSIMASVLLARRMVAPIRALQEGASRIGAGDLAHRVDVRTGDELEALGSELNRTAGHLEESYANLEQKVEARTRELAAANAGLTETLEQQTATAEILRAISSSPTDIRPVLDTVVSAAARFCGATDVAILRLEGATLRGAAGFGQIKDVIVGQLGSMTALEVPVTRRSVTGRAVVDRDTVHVGDLATESEDEFPEGRALQARFGHHAMVATPLLREGTPVGAIALFRMAPEPFSDRQLDLLRLFADQAVIAIENVRLFTELETKNQDLTETLEQQTATGEILRVISSSPTDVQPVFDTIAERAMHLCGGSSGGVLRFDGELVHIGALANVDPADTAALRSAFPMRPSLKSASARAVLTGAIVEIPDNLAEPGYGIAAQARGFRSVVSVPMLREGSAIGVVTVGRPEPGRFSDRQVALLKTFADQAVIAIENVRLFTELEARNHDLTETLEQQTATGEILRVISSSPTDVQPVFDSIAKSAAQLCRAEFSWVFRFDGRVLHFAAQYGLSPAGLAEVQRVSPMALGRGSAAARSIVSRTIEHIPDVQVDPDYELGTTANVMTFSSIVAVPMLRDGLPAGTIVVARSRAGLFPDRQIDLLKTFADQAVIAIENVRLFTELEKRNHDLTETLEQQTATAQILRVISSSPTDAQPVFDTIAESAVRLCEAEVATVTRFDGEWIHVGAIYGSSPAGVEALRRAFPMRPSGAGGAARAIRDRAIVHIPDILADPEYQIHETALTAGFHGLLGVPMLREGIAIGAITLGRAKAGTFSDKQVQLLRTFADQAVIAIENVRLFQELEARNHDLTETLEQQTATSEILRVISSSPTDVQPVFDAIVRSAVRLCDGLYGFVGRFDGEQIHLAAHYNYTPEALRIVQQMYPMRPSRQQASGRVIMTGAIVHIEDVLDDAEYAQDLARASGWRGLLGVPLLRDGNPVGVVSVMRGRPGRFSEAQVGLLKTFADQAVIAIENVRLFQELEARNAELTGTLARQTATSEVLRAISRAQTDAQPVFDIIAASALRLCGGGHSGVWLYDGKLLHVAALENVSPDGAESIRSAFPIPADERSLAGRAILARAVVQIPDVLEDPAYGMRSVAYAAGFRAFLAAPMLRGGEPIGVIGVSRPDPGPFPESQIELLKTFADQAIIAIENVRLFTELEARTGDLTRSIGELRALGEVSQAVSSTLDLETVLETIVSRAVQLSGCDQGIVYEFDEGSQAFQARATHHISPQYLDTVRAAPIRLGEGLIGRAGVERKPLQVDDIQESMQFVAPQVRDVLAHEGMRSLLALPLIREGRLLGGLVILRRERGAFSPEVVATLQTFAAQSVLAINNAGLFREVQRQKQYSDALVQTSPVAIVTMDLGGKIVGWNPGAERLFQYTETEALGRTMEPLVSTPEVRDEIRSNIRQTLEGEGIRAIGRRARKDGTLVDVEISSMPVLVGGARVGMIGIYHDITELLRARREAEAANEAKSAFLAMMSHEIRTPMNAVIGMSGLLLNTALTDEQHEYAEVVRQSGDALLTVINDILDFSKIEAGKLELESQPFDLRECVEGALDLVATRAAEKGLDLAYLMGDGTPPGIMGDVTRLRQVLLNLLSNAVKFTERGEVVLSVSAHPLDGPTRLYELTFSVRDTGIGIPPDRLGRLFQSFSQVDASTTRRYGGTGLGLAISQRLTELMGGRIGVTSEVGRGSEFSFTIRAVGAQAPAPVRRDLSGVQPTLRGKRVLVVDDNETNRRILTTHFAAWGMLARATGSPLEALGWIQSAESFDIGILDMHMPEMDGVTLARAIRDHATAAAPPLVLFTSLGRREANIESEGFAAYLHKPIKPSQLFDALVSVLAEQPVHVTVRDTPRSELVPDMARRHPLRILLAEDNVVNQKVALRLLGQMGYRADVAANGLEAIDAVGRQTYDVILMDVQMPELDGFEASREINRRWPGDRRPRIVAMTANAMQGDRELCTAAGMDDYVAKPVRVEELVAALERSPRRPDTGARGATAVGTGEPGAPARPRVSGISRRLATSAEGRRSRPDVTDAPTPGAIDRTAVERLSATMGAPFAAELIHTFIEDGRELIAALHRTLSASDIDAFRRAAHSLKSTGETVGATGLAAIARELEASARAGSLAGAEARVRQVDQAFEIAAHTLEELRRGLPA